MRGALILGIVVVLSATVSGQTVQYCDSLTNICYSSYTSSQGIAYRVAIPDVDQAPFDIIFQIVAPVSQVGWTGMAWGGTMVYNPLSLTWSNGQSAIVSSRMANGLSLPKAYDGASYQLLKGTGMNSTHVTLTAVCSGCSQWGDTGSQTSLLSNGTNTLAFAQCTTAVADPSSNTSDFSVHNHFGKWTHDFSIARTSQFDKLVADNILVVNNSQSAAPSSPAASTTSPQVLATSATVPATGSGSVPTGCAGVAAARFSGSTAPGWSATKLAGSLSSPRGITFDSAGHLLVVESGKGITAFTFGPDGCVSSYKTVVSSMTLNHGIWIHPNGTTLFASTMTSVFSWTYNATTATVSGSSRTIISGMYTEGHPTRTLIMHPSHPNILVVSHGSGDNFDYDSANMATSRACIKAFDLNAIPDGGYNYVSGGYFMGYGLRNKVGLTFDGNNMLWGVENSVDEIQRIVNGTATDIHNNNPADELNYIGNISTPNTNWYGYPTCFTVWQPSGIPNTKFSIGDQFVLAPNSTFNDTTCKTTSIMPRLSFQAHSAPLDMKFDSGFQNLYVSFHGSSDRNPPTGYKLVAVPFQKNSDGSYGPTATATSNSGYTDIWWNTDVTQCSTTQCFRPVGIEIDSLGRLFVSSDATPEGELFMLEKNSLIRE